MLVLPRPVARVRPPPPKGHTPFHHDVEAGAGAADVDAAEAELGRSARNVDGAEEREESAEARTSDGDTTLPLPPVLPSSAVAAHVALGAQQAPQAEPGRGGSDARYVGGEWLQGASLSPRQRAPRRRCPRSMKRATAQGRAGATAHSSRAALALRWRQRRLQPYRLQTQADRAAAATEMSARVPSWRNGGERSASVGERSSSESAWRDGRRDGGICRKTQQVKSVSERFLVGC